MAEILMLLWFSMICVLIAGFILGYGLGKVRATRKYESTMPKTVQELQSIMDENDILTKENIELMKELAKAKEK